MFIKISQYSQENNCVRVSFLIKFQAYNFIKNGLQHRCFPVDIARYLRTPILKNIYKQLLLNIITSYQCSILFQCFQVPKSSCYWTLKRINNKQTCHFDFKSLGSLTHAFWGWANIFLSMKGVEKLIKQENQCWRKILSQNYLASLFALAGIPEKWYPWIRANYNEIGYSSAKQYKILYSFFVNIWSLTFKDVLNNNCYKRFPHN